MQEGDILVANATDPNVLPAMKKAAAIVTNTGGITCHAAIVSRELNIPCVVGTRIATKVFHDGELVEVRAHHGLVRKMKESEAGK
jgi:pyruvate,water dikinase